MYTYNKQRIRVLQDVSKWTAQGTEVLTGDSPRFANGCTIQFEFGFTWGDLAADANLLDMNQYASVRLDIKRNTDRSGLPLMTKTIAETDFLKTLTKVQWDAGNLYHVAFEFTEDEANLYMTTNTETLWLVVTATTVDSPAKTVPLAAWTITVVEEGSGGVKPGRVAEPAYYTAAQCDARFLLTYDISNKLSRDGSLAMTGELTLANGTPSNVLAATAKSYVDGLIALQMPLAGTSTVTGAKTFSALLTASAGATLSALTLGSGTGLLKATAGAVTADATTDDLTEGATNLYYTTARINSHLGALYNVANGICQLDADGLVQDDQFPTWVTSNVYEDASEVAMTASRSAFAGHVSVRSDVRKSFMLKLGGTETNAADWIELLSPVASVNGDTGVVVLTADDIAEGTNLFFTEARVRATVLTGVNTALTGSISATDSILQAFGRTEYRLAAMEAGRALKAGDTFTGAIQFSGTGHLGLKVNSLTNAQALALTATNGYIYYDSTQQKLIGIEGSSRKQLLASGTGTTWHQQAAAFSGSSPGAEGDYGVDTTNGAIYFFDTGGWVEIVPAMLRSGGDTMTGVLELQSGDPEITINTVAGSWNITASATANTLAFDNISASGIQLIWDTSTVVDLNIVTGSLKVGGTKVVGTQGATIADPAGGGTVDAEARTAIGTIIDRLQAHGLIAT